VATALGEGGVCTIQVSKAPSSLGQTTTASNVVAKGVSEAQIEVSLLSASLSIVDGPNEIIFASLDGFAARYGSSLGRAWLMLLATSQGAICSPRHPTHFEPWYLEGLGLGG
jgi:hypothetical protein